MAILTTRNLGKRYGERVGIEQVDLTVESGTVFGFLGPNGAGKTTAIRLLLGFLRPTVGEAKIFELDCWSRSHEIKRDTGYLPGDLRLYPWFNVKKALPILSAAHGRDLRTAGMALAERFGLDPVTPVRKMSRGMRQKVGIVLALAHDPRLIVLDEPTSGLDPLVRLSLAALLRERVKTGATVFFSSHTLSEVESLCDRGARRRVELRFEDEAAAVTVEPPPFLDLLERDGDRWLAEFDGEAGELRRWLADRPVRDFTVGPPDLETIFHAYYRRDGAA
jgi:ABC-2 type transport system ATP-binding protein